VQGIFVKKMHSPKLEGFSFEKFFDAKVYSWLLNGFIDDKGV
jgi:hypothetical protein